MYKLVYNADKRFIVFDHESRLVRFLGNVNVVNRNFRLYKSSKKGK